MKKTIINEDRAIVLYNAAKKEMIGIFEFPTLAFKYLYPLEDRSKSGKITYAAINKSKMHNTVFDFPVAVRYANDDQLKLMSGTYTIFNGYYIPMEVTMKGFTDTCFSLSAGFKERIQKRLKEQERARSL